MLALRTLNTTPELNYEKEMNAPVSALKSTQDPGVVEIHKRLPGDSVLRFPNEQVG